jgi:DNA-binding IclR family transcriptional regulator
VTEVRSAARVLDLLEYLQGQAEPRSLSQIAVDLLLPKSSTLLLLRTLVDRGYALRNAGDRYVAAPHRVAPQAIHDRLVEVALPEMRACSARTRETVLLGVMVEGGRMRVLAKQVSPQELRYDADLTALRPSYCTAMGRVVLAALPRAQRQRVLAARKLRPFTPHTVTDPAAIEAILRQAEQDGYASVEEQYLLGASGVAAPIRDGGGRVVAALDIASVTSRFAATRAALVAAAVSCAEAIGRQLRHPAESAPVSSPPAPVLPD